MTRTIYFVDIDGSAHVVNDARGVTVDIDKDELIAPNDTMHVDAERIARIAIDWSWVNCGVITVAHHNDQFYVLDGVHRVFAAQQRDDITTLPCMVFEAE